MTRKQYTREFKLTVVQAVESGELRPAQACREYQLAESVLARWRQEVQLRGDAAFEPLEPSPTYSYELRIADLERMCGQLAVENAALQKSLAACPVTTRHELMTSLQQELPTLSLRQLCRLLGVSRSWLYERPHRLLQQQRDVALRDEIEHIVLDYPGYGYRRVTAELRRRNWNVNHKRVLRILRQEGLLCELKRRWTPTTDSRHQFQTYENLLKGRDVS